MNSIIIIRPLWGNFGRFLIVVDECNLKKWQSKSSDYFKLAHLFVRNVTTSSQTVR